MITRFQDGQEFNEGLIFHHANGLVPAADEVDQSAVDSRRFRLINLPLFLTFKRLSDGGLVFAG
jgi:hypothetical protein